MATTVVGLDIGTSAVRAAEFRLGSRGPVLRKFASVPLPTGAMTAGAIVDPTAVTAALRSLWSEGKFSTRTVAFGVANDGVLVRQMDLDWMPAEDFRQALRYQVADALPVPVDKANLDYHLLEEVDLPGAVEGEARRISRILLVAASREAVDGYVNAAQAAGLRVIRADLIPFALIRATNPSHDDAHTEAIVDIGSDTLAIVVHRGGQPLFVRMIPGIGGDVITRAVQERYNWTWDDAEHTKVVVGLPNADMEHPAQHVIADKVVDLIAEIRTTLNFFLDSDPAAEQAPTRVVLTGAGSLLGGLPELMTEELGVPTQRLQVLSGLRKARGLDLDDSQEASLTIAAGLCMGGVR